MHHTTLHARPPPPEGWPTHGPGWAQWNLVPRAGMSASCSVVPELGEGTSSGVWGHYFQAPVQTGGSKRVRLFAMNQRCREKQGPESVQPWSSE